MLNARLVALFFIWSIALIAPVSALAPIFAPVSTASPTVIDASCILLIKIGIYVLKKATIVSGSATAASVSFKLATIDGNTWARTLLYKKATQVSLFSIAFWVNAFSQDSIFDDETPFNAFDGTSIFEIFIAIARTFENGLPPD